MNKEEAKRIISFAVFGLGMLGGLWGCARYAHGMFVANDNDSPPGLLAITLAFATPLPACVMEADCGGRLAYLLGCYLPIGMLLERAFLIHVRHAPDQFTAWQTLTVLLPYSSVLIALGSFGLVTGLLKWPKLL